MSSTVLLICLHSFSHTYAFSLLFLLMLRLPPRSTRTATLFPYTTLFRSIGPRGIVIVAGHRSEAPRAIGVDRQITRGRGDRDLIRTRNKRMGLLRARGIGVRNIVDFRAAVGGRGVVGDDVSSGLRRPFVQPQPCILCPKRPGVRHI